MKFSHQAVLKFLFAGGREDISGESSTFTVSWLCPCASAAGYRRVLCWMNGYRLHLLHGSNEQTKEDIGSSKGKENHMEGWPWNYQNVLIIHLSLLGSAKLQQLFLFLCHTILI